MTATLERRIVRLEDSLPPPPLPPEALDWPGDEPPAWWGIAPEAVRAYAVALLAEAAALAGRRDRRGVGRRRRAPPRRR